MTGAKRLGALTQIRGRGGSTVDGFPEEGGSPTQDIETLLNIQCLRVARGNKIRSQDKNVEPETLSESLGHTEKRRSLSQAHLEKRRFLIGFSISVLILKKA